MIEKKLNEISHAIPKKVARYKGLKLREEIDIFLRVNKRIAVEANKKTQKFKFA